MMEFEFCNPTRIIFGKGKIAEIAKHVPADAHVLVLYGGGSIKQNGTLDEVRTALGARHVQEFEGIEPNPTYETLMRAVTIVRRDGIDFLLAVGGGSVLDGTKFVAAAAVFDGEPWDILLQGGANVRKALPIGTVLTLPATGSEMNTNAVISRKEFTAKLGFASPHVYPLFSVLDPEKTFTLPPRQVANGVVDAFVHVVEQYLTYPVNAVVQDRLAEGLLQALIEIGPKALAAPQDYSERANLMWAATLALNGLIGAGVPQDWATHAIGHELTALYGLDHGRTLAVLLPPGSTVRREAKRAKLLQYAERVWHITSGGEDERIDAAIARTREFFENLGVKTRLADYGVDASAAAETVEAQLQAHGMTAFGERGDVSPALARTIVAHS